MEEWRYEDAHTGLQALIHFGLNFTSNGEKNRFLERFRVKYNENLTSLKNNNEAFFKTLKDLYTSIRSYDYLGDLCLGYTIQCRVEGIDSRKDKILQELKSSNPFSTAPPRSDTYNIENKVVDDEYASRYIA